MRVIRRPDNGWLLPVKERFPHGMKPLVDFVHGLGFKMGLYLSGGRETCRGQIGSCLVQSLWITSLSVLVCVCVGVGLCAVLCVWLFVGLSLCLSQYLCVRYPRSRYGYYSQDTAAYDAWGVDYVKEE